MVFSVRNGTARLTQADRRRSVIKKDAKDDAHSKCELPVTGTEPGDAHGPAGGAGLCASLRCSELRAGACAGRSGRTLPRQRHHAARSSVVTRLSKLWFAGIARDHFWLDSSWRRVLLRITLERVRRQIPCR